MVLVVHVGSKTRSIISHASSRCLDLGSKDIRLYSLSGMIKVDN